jgi:aminopeptidase N
MKILYTVTIFMWYLLIANTTFAYTHADTLRGSNGPGRSWWDVQHYDLILQFDTLRHSIAGQNTMVYKITSAPHDSMQIDLQDSMILDEALHGTERLKLVREGNVYWIIYPFSKFKKGSTDSILLSYHGTPRIARNPPWNGGFVWSRDSSNKLWLAVACQGTGASVWWPCKDIQSDEPDLGMDMTFKVPWGLACISNGRLLEQKNLPYNYTQYHWQVKNPINSYDVTFYIGDYIHFTDTLMGEKGALSLDFWALRYNEQKAKKQFEVVKPMLHCFESWMGPYPFYEDGYKLVEAPYLGMEHQSAVAYGNQYKMGYLGYDRSLSGVGMNFDFIIVHESGHEWFGNSITATDIADNWIHEGITTYTETLFAECLLGKEKAFEYCRGEWKNIRNHAPVIGDYGVNSEGAGDMYDKGAAIMHMIRVMMDDDAAFKKMMRGMSKQFYHSMVSSIDIENYIIKESKLKLKPFFQQYLYTADIPELEYYIKDNWVHFHFTNVPEGFKLPIGVSDGHKTITIQMGADWVKHKWNGGYNLQFSKDFLYREKEEVFIHNVTN